MKLKFTLFLFICMSTLSISSYAAGVHKAVKSHEVEISEFSVSPNTYNQASSRSSESNMFAGARVGGTTGAVIGGLYGGCLGMMVGDSPNASGRAIAGGVVAGAAIGALIFGAIGALTGAGVGAVADVVS